jgi:protein-S-isoprenylcysteine O-methyltransferase Ste14
METLRNSAWFILIAFAGYGVVHSLMASLGFKDFVYGLMGELAERYYRMVFNLFSFFTLLPILALPLTIPDVPLYTIPDPWSSVTLAVQGISLALLIYSLFQTGAFEFVGLSQMVGIKAKDKLNTRGLYRYMRHPLYTFSMLFLWLTPVMTRNLAVLYLSFTLYFVIGALVEERKMVRLFGQAYVDYQVKVGMFFPVPKLGECMGGRHQPADS